MIAALDTVLTRWIPAPANRVLWKMYVGVIAAFALTGPVWGSAIAAEITDSSYWSMLPHGYTSNVLGLVVGAITMGILMRNWSRTPLTPHRQVVAVVAAGAATVLGRFAAVLILRYGYPGVGPIMILTNLGISVSVIAMTAIIILYAARREHELEASYAQTLAARDAVLREEDDVRARIFDDLHGTAQARVLDVRIRIRDIAANPDAGEREGAAQALDRELLDFYESHLGRLARTMYPSGLEVSLLAALGDLRDRHQGIIAVNIDADAVSAALDDPIVAGIHRDLRIALYRVAEECVVNAVRHGQAERVDIDVSVTVTNGQTWLTVEAISDCREPAQDRFGHGLSRMRQRMELLGGTVNTHIEPGTFTVRATVPTARSLD